MKEWPYGPTTMALAPRTIPRDTRIFRRGDWKRPGEAVTPATPAVLNPFPAGAPRNRLGLAQWIVDKNNPLTARVIVNRVWQQYFGTGLVTTPEDFGARCEQPSHPALLDWLAVEFRESGWSLKHLHRLIVNSAVYRQSSKLTPKLQEADPTNTLLARAPRMRTDAEIIRDIAMGASGLLSRKMFGPPVYPPIPDGVLSLGYGAQLPWPTATGEERYRRAMYTFWKRSVPYPSMIVFDQPNGDFFLHAACPFEYATASADDAQRPNLHGSGAGFGAARFQGRRQQRRGENRLRLPPLHRPQTRRFREETFAGAAGRAANSIQWTHCGGGLCFLAGCEQTS